MAEENATPEQTPEADGAQAHAFMVIGQYVKDLSFEAPGAPGIFDAMRKQQPEIQIGLDVASTPQQNDNYEVVLKVHVQANLGAETAYILEIEYAGLFHLKMPKEHLEPMLLIECPRILFPFARNIICDVSRDGGFTPLLLQPVDFAQLYRQRMEQAAAAGNGGAPEAQA
ncbi:MAG: protein-export chaperone SecB [Rhodospirillales bacterium]|nr:protein-export chaperone SecB [Rhodospirillales bacterium]MCW8861261.1 protein-export chaperone SecB [Rhodospirillales bacterium]MCW8971336.1 protein-export chaperone SecB [Rhodospirillales bacterium]MCW9039121.1 protein-export chaperone SecB [Rhodospirillales bacterium]